MIKKIIIGALLVLSFGVSAEGDPLQTFVCNVYKSDSVGLPLVQEDLKTTLDLRSERGGGAVNRDNHSLTVSLLDLDKDTISQDTFSLSINVKKGLDGFQYLSNNDATVKFKDNFYILSQEPDSWTSFNCMDISSYQKFDKKYPINLDIERDRRILRDRQENKIPR